MISRKSSVTTAFYIYIEMNALMYNMYRYLFKHLKIYNIRHSTSNQYFKLKGATLFFFLHPIMLLVHSNRFSERCRKDSKRCERCNELESSYENAVINKSYIKIHVQNIILGWVINKGYTCIVTSRLV